MNKIQSIVFVFMLIPTLLLGNGKVNLNRSYWEAVISGNTKLKLTLHCKKNDRFELTSVKGGSQIVLGNKYWPARITGKAGTHAIEITGNMHEQNDTVFMEGKYRSLTSTQEFSGWIVNNRLEGKLTSNTITGFRTESPAPCRDYRAIARAMIDTTEHYLYNPELMQISTWESFKNNLFRLSATIHDDYEFEKLCRRLASDLPFSHFGIAVKAPASNDKSDHQPKVKKPAKFALTQIDSTTQLFTIKSFSASAEEIRPFIDSMKTLSFSNLIVDLRNNTGGTIASALPLASYLVNDTLMGGVFLTKRYFNDHTELPTIKEFQNFPLFSEASFELIINGIHNQKGLCLKIIPEEHPYTGNLILLVNRYTASTCEPLVYGLKQASRAFIIGETTCGAMLNGEQFTIANDFNLWVPTADFYAADGYKIDKQGVPPHLKTDPEQALEVAIEYLKKL